VDAAYIVKKLDCSDVSINNVTVNADQREASVQLPSVMSSEDVHGIIEKLHGSSWHKRHIDVSVMEHASSQSSSHSSSSSNNDASSSSSSSLSNHAFPATQMQSQHLGSLFAPIDSGVPFTLFGAAPANTASDAFVLPPVQATTVAYLNPDEVYFHDSHPPRFDWACVPIIPFSQVLYVSSIIGFCCTSFCWKGRTLQTFCCRGVFCAFLLFVN
jgi:hypothetical protein